MEIIKRIEEAVVGWFQENYNQIFTSNEIQLQETRKEFDGEITLVVFPFIKTLKLGPEKGAELMGNFLMRKFEEIEKFNTIKGFLNLSLKNNYILSQLLANKDKLQSVNPSLSNTVMVEYSSPNTNKPLHLGHVRNNLLGYQHQPLSYHLKYEQSYY
jgi:arginyl-tRNA synthetase